MQQLFQFNQSSHSILKSNECDDVLYRKPINREQYTYILHSHINSYKSLYWMSIQWINIIYYIWRTWHFVLCVVCWFVSASTTTTTNKKTAATTTTAAHSRPIANSSLKRLAAAPAKPWLTFWFIIILIS